MYQHALAEVFLGEQGVIVDPTYGFYFMDRDGRPIGLDELRPVGQAKIPTNPAQ
jgi:hypothetical protein